MDGLNTAFLIDKTCLVIDNCADTRLLAINALKRVGFSINMIEKTDNYSDGMNLLKENRYNFLVVAQTVGTKNGADFFPLHMDMHPDRLRAGFVLLLAQGQTSKDLGLTPAEINRIDCIVESGFDEQALAMNLNAMINHKANPDPYQEAISMGNGLLDEGCIDQAMDIYRGSKELSDTPSEAYLGVGLCHLKKGDKAEAKRELEQSYMLSSENFTCLSELLKIYLSEKEDRKAYEVCTKIYKNHPISEEQISIFTRLIVSTGHFDEMLNFCEIVCHKVPANSPSFKSIAAGLAVAGKSLLDQNNKNDAVKVLLKGVFFAKGDIAILRSILTTLVESGKNYNDVVAIFDGFDSKIRNQKEFSSMELEIRNICGAGGDVIKFGTDILRRGVRTIKVYDILIKRYIELGGRKDVVEDLCMDACKTHPSLEERFKRYLKNV